MGREGKCGRIAASAKAFPISPNLTQHSGLGKGRYTYRRTAKGLPPHGSLCLGIRVALPFWERRHLPFSLEAKGFLPTGRGDLPWLAIPLPSDHSAAQPSNRSTTLGKRNGLPRRLTSRISQSVIWQIASQEGVCHPGCRSGLQVTVAMLAPDLCAGCDEPQSCASDNSDSHTTGVLSHEPRLYHRHLHDHSEVHRRRLQQ